jgi:hypothetical protein
MTSPQRIAYTVGTDGFLNWQIVDSLRFDQVELADEGTDLDHVIELAEEWIAEHHQVPSDTLLWDRRPDGSARCTGIGPA